ncbi:gas vesicle protein GvpJ [Halogeometricum luteum]|uniref:gas vesicle protein GvpJ n=1 Tax=Halogeometricum luteum TaxID=2950537 RepID=UPI003CCD977E
MPDPVRPGRDSDSLADVVELLLDKGVVLNADIVVSVGETELLGIRLRAALASFETASEFGLEFPSGTDMEAVEAASERRRRAKMSPSGRPGLEGERGDDEGETGRSREDRSVDVMNAKIGEEASERSVEADENGDETSGGEDESDDESEDETRGGGGNEEDDGNGGDDGDDENDENEEDDGE